jgi:methyltransferase-like protein
MRWQAGLGMKATNLRHERIELDAVMRILVQLLDGEHDREQMLAYFMLLHEQGKFTLSEKTLETAAPEDIVRKQIEETLQFMGRAGMLVGEG